jgi:hypothetical protein
MITSTLFEAARKIADQVGAKEICWNRGDLITDDFVNKYGESAFTGSLYFCANGIKYRVADHRLPARRFLQQNDDSFVSDNIEVIFERIPNGYMLTNTFFNFNK